MQTKVYTGQREADPILSEGRPVVLVNGEPLHNPDPDSGTFEWGYMGGGPTNLAFAILMDCLKDEARAKKLAVPFKVEFIGHLRRDEGWTLTERQVLAIVEQIERSAAR